MSNGPWQIWESGEPNFYTVTVNDRDWVMRIQMNGTYTVPQQKEMLNAITDDHNGTGLMSCVADQLEIALQALADIAKGEGQYGKWRKFRAQAAMLEIANVSEDPDEFRKDHDLEEADQSDSQCD